MASSHNPSERPSQISDHIIDQFPGQFPTDSTEPYRPPLAKADGGPGLAADYYGDAGESVSQQPGVRPVTPAFIVGAEPHLMAALAQPAPPPEPSTTGAVGAAASFFTGDNFDSPSGAPNSSHQNQQSGARPPAQHSNSLPSNLSTVMTGSSSFYTAATGQSPSGAISNNAQSANGRPLSSGVIPGLGSAAIGAAAGYMLGGGNSPAAEQTTAGRPPVVQASSFTYPGNDMPTQSTGTSNIRPPVARPDFPMSQQPNVYPTLDHPPGSGMSKPSSSTNVPLYLAGAAGAAGLAAAAYHHNHDNSSQSYSTRPHQPPPSTSHDSYNSLGNQHGYANGGTSTMQRHRDGGPLSKLVDFFRDPEGVAQMEEYMEYIGVCRYCFEPGSSPRDAPRKHNFRKRASNERLSDGMRVSKERRYSDGENRRKASNSAGLIAAGIAGVGLAQVGQGLLSSNRENDDSYSRLVGKKVDNASSVRVRRHSSSSDRERKSTRRHSHKSRSRSRDRAYTGSIRDGKIHKKGSHDKNITVYSERRRSRSDSRRRRKKSGLTEVAIAAAAGSALVGATARKRSPSPKTKSKGENRDSQESRKEPYIEVRRTRVEPETTAFGGIFSSDAPRKEVTRRKKKDQGGFFNLGNASTSSTDSALAFGAESDRQRKKKSKSKKLTDSEASAALIGLGATAAALAAAQGGNEGPSSLQSSKERTTARAEKCPTPIRSTRTIEKTAGCPLRVKVTGQAQNRPLPMVSSGDRVTSLSIPNHLEQTNGVGDGEEARTGRMEILLAEMARFQAASLLQRASLEWPLVLLYYLVSMTSHSQREVQKQRRVLRRCSMSIRCLLRIQRTTTLCRKSCTLQLVLSHVPVRFQFSIRFL